MEFCSNTDKVDLPSWCVEADFTIWTWIQLIGEIILLGLLFFTSYSYFKWKRNKRIEKLIRKRRMEREGKNDLS
tara:strand:+ start:439 stop:660 length:222 start_codon:yes stop_codon:yes gene_type:complete